MTADTGLLEQMIPEIVAFGTRTIAQQSVTSAVFIAFRAQELTPAAEISRIDSELEVAVTPVLSTRGKNKGLPLKSGKKSVAVPDASAAMMIAIARLHPNSKYSQMTGNRWPVAMPNTEGREEFFDAMARVAARMVSARHSSTHFLQTGWTSAIRKGLASPLYRYFKGGASRSEMRARRNQTNTLNSDNLGGMTIDLTGDACVVTAENTIGDSGNEVLAKKHRDALILYGSQPLQQAIDEESSIILEEIQRRLDAGMKQDFSRLL